MLVGLTVAIGICLSGCGGGGQSYEDVLLPVGAVDNQFYYLHFAEWSKVGDYPSSLWVVDVQTEESRRVAGPELQHYLEVSGDYYIFPTTEEGADGVETKSLTGVQISTGQRFTIFDGLENVSYVLEGSRLAYAAGMPQTQIVVYDLDARDVLQTVDLPQGASGVWGLDDTRVLTFQETPETEGDATSEATDVIPVLIDLDTGELTELPPGPQDWVPMPYGSNALAGDWIVTTGMETVSGESSGAVPMSVVAWRISAGTWRVLATYEPAAGAMGVGPVAFAFVNDLNAAYAAVYGVTGVDWATELIELESGERTELTGGGAESVFGSDTAIPYLGVGAAYWVDRSAGSLAVYEISSATRRTVTLGF